MYYLWFWRPGVQIEVSAELISSDGGDAGSVSGFSPWLAYDCLLLPFLTSSSLSVCLRPNLPFLEDTSHVGLRSTLMTSF